jgi:hypothetical protein
MRRGATLTLAFAMVAGIVSASARAGELRQSTSPVSGMWSEPQDGYGFLDSAIGKARSSIDMSMYELADPTLEQALLARAAAGVDVEVLLNAAYSGTKMNSPAAALLAKGGVHVHFAPSTQIFHAKYVLIDDRTAYIGTGNLVAADYPTTRDFWVADVSPADISAIRDTFAADFAGHVSIGAPAGGLVWSPGSTARLVELIASARSTLDVENEEMDSTTIEAALTSAAHRGVNVEVAMTADPSWMSALETLARAGVHVRLLGSSQLYIHAKVICVDCTNVSGTVFIGSENFSTSSLSYNRELGLVTSASSAVGAVRRAVSADFASGVALQASGAAPASTDPSTPSHREGVSIMTFVTSISPGTEDDLSAHSSKPGDTCSLSVRLPSGYMSESNGLGSETADAAGDVTWRWEIGPSTRGGTATASVSCQTGSSERDFTIT